MKFATLLKSVVCSSILNLQLYAGNYEVIIKGEKHEITLGENTSIELAGGGKLDFLFKKKEIFTFKGEKFSFDHSSKFTPARSDLGVGIHQTMVMSPTGSGILVQEYDIGMPPMIVDLMIHELTNEEVEFGYNITKSPLKVAVNKEITLEGKRVELTLGEEGTVFQVLTYIKRDKGGMVVTMMDKEASDEERQMLKTFWDTLKLSFE